MNNQNQASDTSNQLTLCCQQLKQKAKQKINALWQSIRARLDQRLNALLESFLEKPAKAALGNLCFNLIVCLGIAVGTYALAWWFGTPSFIDVVIRFFTYAWEQVVAYKGFILYVLASGAFVWGLARKNSPLTIVSTQLIRFSTTALMVKMLLEVMVKIHMDFFDGNEQWMFDLPLATQYPIVPIIAFCLLWYGTTYLMLRTLKAQREANKEESIEDQKNKMAEPNHGAN
ncbi:hypothetical protein MA786_002941 [Vibrio parahaemolyticus]|nr:hypothetical protein [Vibrio parahaemolyticus]EIV8640150.1 hypothetical protein [Vibrio parahaemolyticus]